MSRFARPVVLGAGHDVGRFSCGQWALDSWLATRALPNQASGASRTYVATRDGTIVVGFYSLTASSVRLAAAPGRLRRNMPDPMPVILLGRLAVDQSYQGFGLGRALLADAVRRVAQAAGAVGVRALLVHAADDTAAGFYRRFGFLDSPIDPGTLFLPIDVIRAGLAGAIGV